MKEQVEEYLEFLQRDHPFVIDNSNYMIAFARDMINKCDDETYFWLRRNKNPQLKETSLKTSEILTMVYNAIFSLSEDLGREFCEDVKNGKIRFIKTGIPNSQFIVTRSAITRELEDYEFSISYTGTIRDAFHVMHEYMHKLIEKINVPIDRDMVKIDIYDEGAAIFAELMLVRYLFEKYPSLRDDIRKIIGMRVGNEIDGITALYETLRFISKVKAGIPEDKIKEECENGSFSYEAICEHITSKEGGNEGVHFVGLLIAINIYNGSTDPTGDFLRIVEEGRNGKCKFLAEQVPSSPSDITRYVMAMRNSLWRDNNKTIGGNFGTNR